jgi:bifunctional non-homologous end joining protein LigD
LFELKLDGFRAIAHVEGHQCRLISRNGHRFNNWGVLCTEISHSIRAESVVLDGEIVCVDDDGRPNFHKLLFRRDWPYFFAFDLLSLDGKDLRQSPLIERKRLLKALMPTVESRLRYVDHVRQTGTEFYRLICREDLEGIVAKWKKGTYQATGRTSWRKIKNSDYSQAVDRHELFEKRRPAADRARWTRPELFLV